MGQREAVSVIMPVYNGAAYIEKGIRSVIGQNYDYVELIIINDGSQDCSAEIVRRIMTEDRSENVQIKYIEQENKGIAEARNAGLAVATGKYVMFLDHDDYLESDGIGHLVQKAEATGADEVMGGYTLSVNRVKF